MDKKYRVLGVCGGNGVILYPFRDNLIGNIEPRGVFHSNGEKQWFSNFSQPIWKTLPDKESYIGKVDVIVGAPDCGHSSVLALSRGKKLTDAKNNDSLMLFINQVLEHKPKVFFMENLPAMLKTMTKEWLEKTLRKYELHYIIQPVTFYGNSQVTRKRLVVIGILKKGLKRGSLVYIRKNILSMNTPKRLKFTKELLAGLKNDNVSKGNVREDHEKLISLYVGKKNRITVKKAQRLWLGRFKDKKRWVVGRDNMTNQPGVYRNLENHPPLTATKGDRQFRPDGLPMSPRELGRIQGLEDSFKIYIDPDNKQYWINKGRATVSKSPCYEMGIWFYTILNDYCS